MISQIHIKNFKSIVDLTLDLGRVNLFIGENGSGKSNILEAVAFANATNNERINNSVLVSKGVRISVPDMYNSAFNDDGNNSIFLDFIVDNKALDFQFHYDKDNGWLDMIDSRQFFENIKYGSSLSNYVIYSPEVTSLRKFEEEGQVSPLGAKGEGLFNVLKSLSKDNGSLQHIKEHLELIDWFEDFAIPGDLMSNEYKISIKDRFINSDLKYLDQRSANEGFLFLLFYVVLFSSKKTPQFFAIDNIEASFNPKLCAKLITTLAELARKNEKQVLMTTHNPATLDGLDLKDPEQRLFMVERNIDGHTIATRISEKPKITAPMKLSEMWTKGFLGGLPENF